MRVIYTARTVSSRLPLITNQFEQNVTHDPPRAKFNVPYAEYLKIHYKGVTVMPGDEADGCEPDVSPFEIATQSWQTFDMVYKQTHDPQWLTERDHVERLAVAYVPKNMIDLNWKIMLMVAIDRAKYSAQIDQLISQLYEYETPQGGGLIRSIKRLRRRILFPITPCWRWPRLDGVRKAMSTWHWR